MDDRLIEASQRGDIDVLYELMQADAEVLRRIDEIMFVDTPLHIAASVGQTCFAMEMMNLMPSFARKLNKSGLSPMHHAIQNGKLELVLLFLKGDCDLVCVKGKEGLTPLHFAVTYGNIDLLAKFLVACPKSIEDVTVYGETALHIAMKNNILEAFEVLVRWLQRICHEDAFKWKENIPNRKDLQGKTVLDIALSNNQLEFIQLLAEIDAKDSEGNHKIITSCTVQNRQTSSSDQSRKTLTNYIRSKTSFDERFSVFISRHKMKISDDALNALLVVLGLLVAATYPATFNPPGSVRPYNDDDNNNSTFAIGKPPPRPGTVVMSSTMFILFSVNNTVTLHTAVCLAGLLLPDGVLGSTLMNLLFFLLNCYDISLHMIAPSDMVVRKVNVWFLIYMNVVVILILQIHKRGKRKLWQLCYTSD